MLRIGPPRLEPASSQVQTLSINQQKGPLDGRPFVLVAGARYKNYMQIEIEPFPLVA
jgi:hypothetical protein